MHSVKRILLIFFVLITSGGLLAQEEKSQGLDFNFGTDLVSRYIWRGMEFGGDPAVPQFQPYAAFSYDGGKYGKIELGAWGSYGFTGNYSENDLYLKYTYGTGVLSVSAVLNDYYYPYLGSSFFNFKDAGKGAHTLEAGLAVTGNESFPLSVLISKNVRNDLPGDHSLYIEASYPFTINQVNLNVFAGAAQGRSLWHLVDTDKFVLINFGASAAKTVKISDDYCLPLSISWIMNAHRKQTFLVFKIGLF